MDNDAFNNLALLTSAAQGISSSTFGLLNWTIRSDQAALRWSIHKVWIVTLFLRKKADRLWRAFDPALLIFSITYARWIECDPNVFVRPFLLALSLLSRIGMGTVHVQVHGVCDSLFFLSLHPCTYVPTFPPVCLHTCLFAHLLITLPPYPSIYLSVCLSVYLSIHQSVYLSINLSVSV